MALPHADELGAPAVLTVGLAQQLRGLFPEARRVDGVAQHDPPGRVLDQDTRRKGIDDALHDVGAQDLPRPRSRARGRIDEAQDHAGGSVVPGRDPRQRRQLSSLQRCRGPRELDPCRAVLDRSDERFQRSRGQYFSHAALRAEKLRRGVSFEKPEGRGVRRRHLDEGKYLSWGDPVICRLLSSVDPAAERSDIELQKGGRCILEDGPEIRILLRRRMCAIWPSAYRHDFHGSVTRVQI